MVATVGIVPVSLDFLDRDQDVFPVLPAPRVDLAVDVADLGRVAIRAVAAAQHRIVGHVPARIKLLVQKLVLRRMVTMCSILSSLVGLHARHQGKRQRDRQEELANTVQLAASSFESFLVKRSLRLVLTPSEIGTASEGRAHGAP